MSNSIKKIKRTIIIISIVLLLIALLQLFLHVNSANTISMGGITVENEALIRLLNIIACCVCIFSILVLDITIVLTKKDNKKFYYKLVGIFSIFILVIPIILAITGDYIRNQDIKNKRYTSWWSETEQIHPYNP